MTASIHAFPHDPARPEDVLVDAALDVIEHADIASDLALANAACTLRQRGNDTTHQAAAVKAERIVVARRIAQRVADAPFAWVDEPPKPRWDVALMMAWVIVLAVAAAWWGGTVITKAAANVLAAQENARW